MTALKSTPLFALLLLAPAFASAATTESPTETRTSTVTATATPTVTPGSGSFSLTAYSPDGSPLGSPVFVNGSSGNAMDIVYTAGEPWTPGGGLLTILIPAGLGSVSTANFWVVPAQAGKVLSYSVGGQTAAIQLQNVAQGDVLRFRFGQNASGFAVNSSNTTESIVVYAHPLSLTLGAGGLVPTPISFPIYSPTPTPTATPSYTITQTYTVSPTLTVTETATPSPDWTHTVTPTETPLGAVVASGVYAYPNPFDLKRYEKVTFRFPPASEAKVTVFNLVGEPVRQLDPADINAAVGWAIWRGEDDYSRKATGGLYFVRVKTPAGNYVKKFTVLY